MDPTIEPHPYLAALVVVAFIIFLIWLNFNHKKTRANMTPEEIAKMDEEAERNPGDW